MGSFRTVLMDSHNCWRLLGWTEIGDILLQQRHLSLLAPRTEEIGGGRLMQLQMQIPKGSST
jgi:hypothetical protein